jgi:hypothetical protein
MTERKEEDMPTSQLGFLPLLAQLTQAFWHAILPQILCR